MTKPVFPGINSKCMSSGNGYRCFLLVILFSIPPNQQCQQCKQPEENRVNKVHIFDPIVKHKSIPNPFKRGV